MPLASLLDILQWPALLLGLLGAPLVASQHARTRRAGFAVWLGSNALWITWGLAGGIWSIVLMQGFFCWSSWRGWRNNGHATTAPATSAAP